MELGGAQVCGGERGASEIPLVQLFPPPRVWPPLTVWRTGGAAGRAGLAPARAAVLLCLGGGLQ